MTGPAFGFTLGATRLGRERTRSCGKSNFTSCPARFRPHSDVAAEAAHQRAYMGKADALARLVLRPERRNNIEHAFLVLLGDAAPIVLTLIRTWGPFFGLYLEPSGAAGLEIFERIVDQVSEDLVQRQPVRHDGGTRASIPPCPGFRRFDASCWPGCLEDAAEPPSGSTRRPSRDNFRMALINPSILVVEERMKLTASGRALSRRHRLPEASRRAFRMSDRFAAPGPHFQLAGEAHDVDQGRAQIVTHDIGKALNFVIGAAKLGGALADAFFKSDIERRSLPAAPR